MTTVKDILMAHHPEFQGNVMWCCSGCDWAADTRTGSLDEQFADHLAAEIHARIIRPMARRAHEDISEWGAYTSDYFKEKWNFKGMLDDWVTISRKGWVAE